MDKEKMRSLLEVSVEAVNYIQEALGAGGEDPAIGELLDNLRRIAAAVTAEMQGADGLLQKVYLYACNIQASMEELQSDPSLFTRVFFCEIRPFVLEMQRLWYLAVEVLSDERGRGKHQASLMQAMRDLHTATCTEYVYDVTIVLCAYNKLEYTKAAVESIFSHTDFSNGRVELITINNGSDDGTREYFESLPHTKKINLKYNILGFNAAQYIAEGKYYVGYANDVIATPHWLEHLLAAMESDAHIAQAVPTCNEEGVSNDQGVVVPYQNCFDGMDEMQAFAAAYNQMDPALWEERSQLMPFLSATRTDVYKMGLVDPIYTRAEFVDDDLSTLLRRTGWRQLLLKDTFMHHFGGVTLGADRYVRANNAIVEMRRVYYEKWGVDAWESRGGFMETEDAWSWHDFRANERVLILEPRFGDLACTLVNAYQRHGFRPHMTAAVFDTRYLPDTGYLFDAVMTAADISDISEQEAPLYDVISMGCYLDELPLGDVMADLERLHALLAPGGMMLLPVRNPGSAYELMQIIDEGARNVYVAEGDVKAWSAISYRHLLRALPGHPSLHSYRVLAKVFHDDASLVDALRPLMGGGQGTQPDDEMRLSVRMVFLGIFKT